MPHAADNHSLNDTVAVHHFLHLYGGHVLSWNMPEQRRMLEQAHVTEAEWALQS